MGKIERAEGVYLGSGDSREWPRQEDCNPYLLGTFEREAGV